MPNLSIATCILNWNGLAHLQTYLPSVVATNYSEHKIYVIDNASTDLSVEWLRERYPQIEIVHLKENLGYTGGYNQGLKFIDADVYILLNSDVAVTPNWLEPISEHFIRHPKVAAIQPKILADTNKFSFEYAGAAGGFIDALGYPFCRGRIFDFLEKDDGQYNEGSEIFWASGACLAIRAKAYREIGGFDERFFAHMEEIDLCWRLQQLDYSIYYEPKSVVYHLGGGTLGYRNPRKTYLNFRNSLLMLYKNLPEQDRDSVIAKRKRLDYLAAAKFLVGRAPKHMKAIFNAHKDFEIMKLDYKQSVSNQKKLSDIPTAFPGLILNRYYLKGKKKFSELKWLPGH